MTTNTSIVNRALQTFGTRTTVTDAELANQTTNEAIQANLVLTETRDQLLRMAPWDCGLKCAPLTLITAVPGTPESTVAATPTWVPGQPMPPWLYEYQYPVDCLRACWIVPQLETGLGATEVPIFPTTTGNPTSVWNGPPVGMKIATDSFWYVTAAAVVAGGTGYVVGDQITLETWAADETPFGAPVTLQVATLSGSAVATVTVVNQILGEASPKGGSYITKQTGTQTQDSTTGSGTGATFSLTYASSKDDQRVILTNQQNALLAYVKQVTNPNVMDKSFQEAWTNVLGAKLCMALTGNKDIANDRLKIANMIIEEARKQDANEGLTVNDVTPDWIRTRGVNFQTLPFNNSFDWGGFWPLYS